MPDTLYESRRNSDKQAFRDAVLKGKLRPATGLSLLVNLCLWAILVSFPSSSLDGTD